MKPQKITVSATIGADTKKVWDYYTSPEHITKWNFASPDWQCPKATNDMRIGGKYSARMEAKDGSWGFDFEATYEALSIGESFTYVMPDDRQVSVDFGKTNGTTNVTIVFDAEAQNPIDMQKDGWQAILDNFKKYVESN